MSIDMFPEGFIHYMLDQENDMDKNTCNNCGKSIKVSINKGTGYCGENCRKVLAGEVSESRAQTDAGITNILSQPTGEVNLGGIR